MLYILFLSPGLIAAYIYCQNRSDAEKKLSFIGFTAVYSLFIFIFNLGILYLRGLNPYTVETIISTVGGAIKFGVIGLIAAIAIPNIHLFVEKIINGKKYV